MAIIRVDPTSPTNGAGTLGDPRNTPPTSVAYGDRVLLKEGTTYSGSWTPPAPTGVGSDTNRVVIGTYDALTGDQIVDLTYKRMATILSNASSSGILIQYDYFAVEGLYIKNARVGAAVAGIFAQNCSYIRAYGNRIDSMGNGGGYGIRFDNATGSAETQTKWDVIGNQIDRTGGNAAIVCIGGFNAGENVTDITVTDNVVYGNPLAIVSTTNTGIRIHTRATAINANRAGLCNKGIRIERNKVYATHSNAYSIMGTVAGGTQANVFRGNEAYNIGDGATDMHAMWFACCDDWVVEDNYVDGTNAWIGQSIGSGAGIFVDKPYDNIDGCNRIKIRRNVLRNTGRGATLNLEVGGGGIAVLLSSDIEIEANVIDGCSNGIVVLGWYGGVEGDTGGNPSSNVRVRNNLVSNSTFTNYFVVKDARNVSLINNVSVGGEHGFGKQTSGVLPVVTGHVETTNLVYGAKVYPWMASNEPEAAVPTNAARAAPGGSLEVDPQLVDVTRPERGFQSGSPCWRAGTFVAWGHADFRKVPFALPCDVGPFARPQPSRVAA